MKHGCITLDIQYTVRNQGGHSRFCSGYYELPFRRILNEACSRDNHANLSATVVLSEVLSSLPRSLLSSVEWISKLCHTISSHSPVQVSHVAVFV